MPPVYQFGEELTPQGLTAIRQFGVEIWTPSDVVPSSPMDRIYGELQELGAFGLTRGRLAPPTNISGSGSHTIYWPQVDHGEEIATFNNTILSRARMYGSLNSLWYFVVGVINTDSMWLIDDAGHYVCVDVAHIGISAGNAVRLQYASGNNSGSQVNLDQETRHCKIPQSGGAPDYVFTGAGPISNAAFDAGWVQWAADHWRGGSGEFIVATADNVDYVPYQ